MTNSEHEDSLVPRPHDAGEVDRNLLSPMERVLQMRDRAVDDEIGKINTAMMDHKNPFSMPGDAETPREMFDHQRFKVNVHFDDRGLHDVLDNSYVRVTDALTPEGVELFQRMQEEVQGSIRGIDKYELQHMLEQVSSNEERLALMASLDVLVVRIAGEWANTYGENSAEMSSLREVVSTDSINRAIDVELDRARWHRILALIDGTDDQAPIDPDSAEVQDLVNAMSLTGASQAIQVVLDKPRFTHIEERCIAGELTKEDVLAASERLRWPVLASTLREYVESHEFTPDILSRFADEALPEITDQDVLDDIQSARQALLSVLFPQKKE